MARFFISRADMRGARAAVGGAELDHLRRVLRLEPGDRVVAFDDAGWEHEAVIRALDEKRAELEITRSYRTERDSPLATRLAVAVTKGDKMDYVVEKTTELGVRIIAPFVSRYTVPKLDEQKARQRVERWRKIALSAAKQCGRTCLPEVFPVCDYSEALAAGPAAGLRLFFWEKETGQTLTQLHARRPHAESVSLFIGPEGGFSAEEAEMARAAGYETVHLGPRILRAETAAVAALSLAQYLWGDLG